MKAPYYYTPDGTTCPECGEECHIVPLLNDFDYAGTHCTYGRSGTHYPFDWGSPVSSCCEAPMEAEPQSDLLDYMIENHICEELR